MPAAFFVSRASARRLDPILIAQTGAVPASAALYLLRRLAARLAMASRRLALMVTQDRNLAFPLKLATSELAGALAASAIVDHQDSKPDTIALDPVRNETVVYQQARRPQTDAEQDYSEHPYTEQVEASDELDDYHIPSNFPCAVQTVRFVNPDASVDLSTVTTVARESVRHATVTYANADLMHTIKVFEQYGLRLLSPDEIRAHMPEYPL